jgi:hypothetical protein
MAIPSYAHLKLKIPKPTGVITVEAKAQRVLDCEQVNIKLATAMAELRELSRQAPSAPLGPTMPPTSSSFKVAEDAKAMQIEAGDHAKTM